MTTTQRERRPVAREVTRNGTRPRPSETREMILADLIVDHRYQRDEKTIRSNAEAWAVSFDPVMCGSLVVAEWQGVYYVLDGQTRRLALMLQGVLTWECWVHYDIAPNDQADYFTRLQRDRQTVKPMEQHKADLFAGNPLAVALDEIASSVGFRLVAGNANGGINGVVALRRTYIEQGAEALRMSLGTIARSWGVDDRPSRQAPIFEGLAIVFNRYADVIQQDRMVKRLQVTPSTRVIQMVAARADGLTMGRPHVAARVFVDLYNKGNRASKLDEVRVSKRWYKA